MTEDSEWEFNPKEREQWSYQQIVGKHRPPPPPPPPPPKRELENFILQGL